jgi:hypothetical protein
METILNPLQVLSTNVNKEEHNNMYLLVLYRCSVWGRVNCTSMNKERFFYFISRSNEKKLWMLQKSYRTKLSRLLDIHESERNKSSLSVVFFLSLSTSEVTYSGWLRRQTRYKLDFKMGEGEDRNIIITDPTVLIIPIPFHTHRSDCIIMRNLWHRTNINTVKEKEKL